MSPEPKPLKATSCNGSNTMHSSQPSMPLGQVTTEWGESDDGYPCYPICWMRRLASFLGNMAG